MAFAVAVAAFGQKLRDDKHLGDYSYADIRRLAGEPSGYLRGEFVKLTQLAANRQVAEVARCVAEGRHESERMTWDGSRAVMAVMDEARRQVGVVYPGE